VRRRRFTVPRRLDDGKLRQIVDEIPTALASLAPDLRPRFIGIIERLN
jgi:hypothetical protein